MYLAALSGEAVQHYPLKVGAFIFLAEIDCCGSFLIVDSETMSGLGRRKRVSA